MKLVISKTKIKKQGYIELTSGMVGATLDLEFSDDWSGLTKKACFRCGAVKVPELNPGLQVTIPHEVLTQPGRYCEVGFYGYKTVGNEKVTVIPTIYVDIEMVKEGADDEGDPPAPAPTPSELEQLQAIAADHEERITNLEEHGGGGHGSDGKSAYEIAVEHGFEGTEAEWLESLKGAPGADGRNGTDGRDGVDGRDGLNGTDGKDGKDGYTPVKGIDYFDGQNGRDGKDGLNGKDGSDGHTPEKGVDYFTDADKQEIVSAVLAALPDGDEVSY